MKFRFDVVGDIAIIHSGPLDSMRMMSRIILDRHPRLKVVLARAGKVEGLFRLCKYDHIAGEDRTRTMHRENGCIFDIDLALVHFSPRLVNERKLVALKTKDGENILNMFGGVGTFSVQIAKKAMAKVFNIDINPDAIRLCLINVLINNVRGRVISILADAKEVTTIFSINLFDRVLLPLPEKSIEYLPLAVSVLKKRGTLQLYEFVRVSKGEDPVEELVRRVEPIIGSERILSYEGRIVKSVGPRSYMVSLEIYVE
ncbi:MAG: class I SAM-dependent methyltransferase [Candidatus Bathyarchaeia archaeon]